MDEKQGKARKARKATESTGAKRIIITIDPKDTEAQAMYEELVAAAKKDRRELGEYMLVQLLSLRGALPSEWFGLPAQTTLPLEPSVQ